MPVEKAGNFIALRSPQAICNRLSFTDRSLKTAPVARSALPARVKDFPLFSRNFRT